MSDTDADNAEALGTKSDDTGTGERRTAPVPAHRPRTVGAATTSANHEGGDGTATDAADAPDSPAPDIAADTESDTTEFTAASTPREPHDVSTATTADSEASKDVAGEKKSRRILLPSLTSRVSGPRSRLLLGAVLVLALVGSIASTVVFYQRDHHNQRILDAQNEARDAACKYAPVLATYDAKNLDAYFTAVLDGATGDWRKQFDSTSKDLRDVLTQGQVVSKATDVQCALRSGDENSAEAIVVIGQTITSVGTQGKPAPGQLSMVMRMERSGHGWLVNKVNSPLAQQPQQ